MAWFSYLNFLIFSLTKNSAEVQAAKLAIEVAAKEGIKKLLINSQNQQLVNSAGWIPGWKVGLFAHVSLSLPVSPLSEEGLGHRQGRSGEEQGGADFTG